MGGKRRERRTHPGHKRGWRRLGEGARREVAIGGPVHTFGVNKTPRKLVESKEKGSGLRWHGHCSETLAQLWVASTTAAGVACGSARSRRRRGG